MRQNRVFFSAGRYIVTVVMFVLISLTGSGQGNNKQDLSGVRKYVSLMSMIKYAYVDSANESKLVEKAIVETLKELDPHSVYISKKDLQRANEELVGNFEGLGIQSILYILSPVVRLHDWEFSQGIRSSKSKRRMLPARRSPTSLYLTDYG